WLADFIRHDPDRYIGLACLPYGDIDAAVKEIKRVAGSGVRGFELSCAWDMEPMWHPIWEPLWQTVNEVGLPLHFHTFPALSPDVLEKQKGLTRRAAFFTVVSAFQMNLVNILAAIVGAAVLERYPHVRIAFGESGIGWIPYALDRMDFEWEDRFHDLGLTMQPPDYWPCRRAPPVAAEQAPPVTRGRMPQVLDGPKGPVWVTTKGAKLGHARGMGSGGREYVPARIHRADRMAATGLYEDGKKGIRRLTEPDLRIKDQDRDGVQAEVLYGILGATGRMNDPDATVEVMRIYNEWLADFCSTHPERSA